VPLLTLLAAFLIPFVGGFFMLILKDPEMAQRMGFISTKAQIAGTADWPSYLGLLAQAVAIGGLIIFGFVSSWVFGREYADRTIKDLLALPISRTSIVI
jgi:ABC-2 type transport system permease protein